MKQSSQSSTAAAKPSPIVLAMLAQGGLAPSSKGVTIKPATPPPSTQKPAPSSTSATSKTLTSTGGAELTPVKVLPPSVASVWGASSKKGETTFVMDIAPGVVGWIIGRSGTRIKDLQHISGCKMWVDQDMPNDQPRKIFFNGSRQQIEMAVQKVNELIDSAPPLGPAETASKTTSSIIDCPAPLVGLLIGKRGWTIKKIQNSSGAQISINQSVREGLPRKIIVTGETASVNLALQLINDVLRDKSSLSDSDDGGSAGGAAEEEPEEEEEGGEVGTEGDDRHHEGPEATVATHQISNSSSNAASSASVKTYAAVSADVSKPTQGLRESSLKPGANVTPADTSKSVNDSDRVPLSDLDDLPALVSPANFTSSTASSALPEASMGGLLSAPPSSSGTSGGGLEGLGSSFDPLRSNLNSFGGSGSLFWSPLGMGVDASNQSNSSSSNSGLGVGKSYMSSNTSNATDSFSLGALGGASALGGLWGSTGSADLNPSVKHDAASLFGLQGSSGSTVAATLPSSYGAGPYLPLSGLDAGQSKGFEVGGLGSESSGFVGMQRQMGLPQPPALRMQASVGGYVTGGQLSQQQLQHHHMQQLQQQQLQQQQQQLQQQHMRHQQAQMSNRPAPGAMFAAPGLAMPPPRYGPPPQQAPPHLHFHQAGPYGAPPGMQPPQQQRYPPMTVAQQQQQQQQQYMYQSFGGGM